MANLKVDLTLNDSGFKSQMQQDGAAAKQFGNVVGAAGESVKDTARAFVQSLGSITNYKRKLTELSKEIVGLEMAWAKMSAEQRKSPIGAEIGRQLAEAKAKAAEFKDTIADTQSEIKQMASDSFRSDAFAQGIDIASTSLQSFVAITQLAGGNTEKLQKAISNLILIQTTANSVVKITNALQSQSSLMLGVRSLKEAAATAAIKLRTAAEQRGTAATISATAAQKALNLVASANPYLLLATAALTVGGALLAFTSNSKSASEQTADTTKEVSELEAKMNDIAKTYESNYASSLAKTLTKYTQLQLAWKALRSEHEKAEFIKANQKDFDALSLSIHSITDAERIFVNETTKVVEAFKLRAQAAAEAARLESLYQEKIEAESKARKGSYQPKGGDSVLSGDADRYGLKEGEDYTRKPGQIGMFYTDAGAAKAAAEAQERNIQTYTAEIESEIDASANRLAAVGKQLASSPYQASGGGSGRSGGSHNTKPDKPTAPSFAAGSLGELEHQLSELQSKYKNGLIRLTPAEYQQQLQTLTEAIANKKIELGLVVPEDKVGKQLEALGQKYQSTLVPSQPSSFALAVGQDDTTDPLANIEQQMNANDALLEQLSELAAAYAALGEAGASGFAEVSQTIANVSEQQAQLTDQAQQYSRQQNKVKKMSQAYDGLSSTVGSLGNAFSSLANSFESPELSIASVIAQAIASIISSYTMAANSPAVTSTGWGWIAFAIAGLAQVAGVIAQIHQLSGYQQGGIVGGGSYVGDKQLVRANSGEMLLNTSQQSRLFNILNGTYQVPNTDLSASEIQFRISGRDLVGVLANNNKIQSKVR